MERLVKKEIAVDVTFLQLIVIFYSLYLLATRRSKLFRE